MIRSVRTSKKPNKSLIEDLNNIINEYNIEPTLYKLLNDKLNLK